MNKFIVLICFLWMVLCVSSTLTSLEKKHIAKKKLQHKRKTQLIELSEGMKSNQALHAKAKLDDPELPPVLWPFPDFDYPVEKFHNIYSKLNQHIKLLDLISHDHTTPTNLFLELGSSDKEKISESRNDIVTNTNEMKNNVLLEVKDDMTQGSGNGAKGGMGGLSKLGGLGGSGRFTSGSGGGSGGGAGGSDSATPASNNNPTYILPVDPYNYFPFFNGFSNVNPVTNPFLNPIQLPPTPGAPFYYPLPITTPRSVDPFHPSYPLGIYPPPYPAYDPRYAYSRMGNIYPTGFPLGVSTTAPTASAARSLFLQFSEASNRRNNKVGVCENCVYKNENPPTVNYVHTRFNSKPSDSFVSLLQSGEQKHVAKGGCIDCKYIDELQ